MARLSVTGTGYRKLERSPSFLLSASSGRWILKFADDTKIFCAVNNDLDHSVLQKDLDNS